MMDAGEKAQLVRSNLRGSGLLLSGRVLSIGIKLLVQILIVRHLAVADYGAWAYGLSFVAFLEAFASLSLNRSVARFAAIHHERGDHSRFCGTVMLVAATILFTGLVFTGLLHAFPTRVAAITGQDEATVSLLLIMVFLVPLAALDTLAVSLFATFGNAGAIFFRRYMLAPALQLAVVVLLLWLDADIHFLAWGFLAAALAGLGINLWLLVHMFREEGLAGHFLRGAELPVREMFSFSLPLISEDLLAALVRASGVFLLGYHGDAADVALFYAVIGLASQSKLVIESFAVLYVPTASRFFASGDFEAIRDLYWRTAIWIAVLSFPVFAVCFVAATPLVELVFGEAYAASGGFLSILAFGAFVEAAMGFNRQTLRVLGRIRSIVTVNVTAALCNVVLALLLVPSLGAVGAALTMSGTWVINNVLRQIALVRAGIGFQLIDERYLRPYLVLALATGSMAAVLLTANSSLALSTTAVAAVAVVTLATRDALQIADLFPRLARIPVLRAFVT